MATIPKQMTLNVRVTPKIKTAFIKRSARYCGTSAVLRDLIEAFVNNRITINPKEIKNVD